jgi:nucleotide-binding universal stress UspA family protein
LKTILVAFDGSESSQHAFELAVELATAFQAAILLVRVVSRSEFDALPESSVERITEELHKLCLWPLSKGISCKYRLDVGAVGDQILQAADDSHADFMVVGSRAHAKGDKLESELREILRRAGGPVTVVK